MLDLAKTRSIMRSYERKPAEGSKPWRAGRTGSTPAAARKHPHGIPSYSGTSSLFEPEVGIDSQRQASRVKLASKPYTRLVTQPKESFSPEMGSFPRLRAGSRSCNTPTSWSFSDLIRNSCTKAYPLAGVRSSKWTGDRVKSRLGRGVSVG